MKTAVPETARYARRALGVAFGWACALLTLAAAAGCVTRESVPYREFAQFETMPYVQRIPEMCVRLTHDDLRKEAMAQRALAEGVLAFWEGVGSADGPYANYLAEPGNNMALIDSQIGAIVADFASYPDKESLAAELSANDWPHGLRDYQLGSSGETADRLAAPLLPGQAAIAVRAWPVWVKRMQPPQGVFPADFAALDRSWTASYASHRRELRRFWVTVKLTMARQAEHARLYARIRTAGQDVPGMAERGGAPLPLEAASEDRLRKLRARFALLPLFQKDYDSFRPSSTGPEPCPMPRVEMFGKGRAWTTVVFSYGYGQHWLATGRYDNPATEPVDMSLYRQMGFGWYVFPFVGWGEAKVLRYPLRDTAQTAPPETVGEGWTLWPLFLYGKGEGLNVEGNNIGGHAYGVPLIFAWGEVQDRHGMRVQAAEALHFLLYAGVNVTQPQHSYAVDALGLGAIWLSTYDQKSDTSVNGPLWGAFGWGKLAGDPVYRVFGFPIRAKKPLNRNVPPEITVEPLRD